MEKPISVAVYLDHEVLDHREAIEAGQSLSGKVVVKVEELMDANDITLQLRGFEANFLEVRTTDYVNSSAASSATSNSHTFFRATLQLYKPIEGEKTKPTTSVFPFEIPLPTSLPSSLLIPRDSATSLRDWGASVSGESEEEDCLTQYFASSEINYQLQVIASNQCWQQNVTVVSADSVEDEQLHPYIFQPGPFSVDDMGLVEEEGKIYLAGRIPDAYLPHGQAVEASLACRNRSTCNIERIELVLEEDYVWKHESRPMFTRVKLAQVPDVAELIPRLRCDPISSDLVQKDVGKEEILAKRMLRDLKNVESQTSFSTPRTARESYHGTLLEISHHLRMIAVTAMKPDSGYPSIRLPIRIGAKSYDTVQEPPDGHTPSENDITFPMAIATPDCIFVGIDAAEKNATDEFDFDVSDQGPSLERLLLELNMSLDKLELISKKMKDLEWAILFGSLSAHEFGTILKHIHFGDVQTKVGILLATAFGGDFTCAHCAEAISNTTEVFRTSMAESLLPYCVDLSENNEVIRNRLSHFEQTIVALHTLDTQGEEENDDNNTSQHSRPASIRPKPKPREGADKATRKGSITPLKDDVCMGDNEHPGTIDFLYIVREVVEESAFPEFCPFVYQRIRKRAKGRRFLIRPYEELPHYWRIAIDREKIEYFGDCFDRDNEMNKKISGSGSDKWGDGYGAHSDWREELRSSRSEWVLAMTVHSYSSHSYDQHEDDDGKKATDICFGKKRHPGNEAMKKAIRKCLAQHKYMEWAPPVYQAIKAELRGRRYFVPTEQGGWEEATHVERRTEMGKYYNMERKSWKQQQQSSAKSSPQQQSTKHSSSNGTNSNNSSPEKPQSRKKEQHKPREEDVCFGLANHPGTKAFHNAVIHCLAEFETTEWSPPVYKAIKAQLKEDARFFIRTEVDSPWIEATSQQRLERIRQQFELSRKKRRMKIGAEAMVN
eukprot:scaffold22560_cov135-Cylindrotheca_fusiformis.AAC.54